MIGKKQKSLRITMDKLLTEFDLTQLELNTLYGLQGVILERVLKEKPSKK